MFPTLFGIVSQEKVATYTVTTTSAQTHTINLFGVSDATTVNWGDGTSDVYTGIALRTHNYASAGTWTVTIYNPFNVIVFDMRDSKVTIDSAKISTLRNVSTFIITTLNSNSVINTADMQNWRPINWQCYSMPAGGTYTINTANMQDWRPNTWRCYLMPAGGSYTINTANMQNWNPIDWRCYLMPAGGSYTINTNHMTAWRPGNWRLHSMPAGGTYTINTANMQDWRPADWQCYSMPAGGTYTINTANMQDWRPNIWFCYSMPAGGSYTINTNHMTAWRPGNWRCHAMPTGTAFTITAAGFANFTTCTLFTLDNNNLSQSQVDTALWSLYQATSAPRTVTGGTINVAGSNAAPSGTFQAATSCPVTAATPGKEVAHELLNDGCGVGFNRWSTVSFTA